MNKIQTNSTYGTMNPKVREILDMDVKSEYPVTFIPYSQTVNDYMKACKPSLVQDIRQDVHATRDMIGAGNRAYDKVSVFEPVFSRMAKGEGSEPGDAELMYALSLDWIVETLSTCQACPAVLDPKRCTGLCVKWGVVPK